MIASGSPNLVFEPGTRHVSIAIVNPQILISAARLQQVFQKVRERTRPDVGISVRLTPDNTFTIQIQGVADEVLQRFDQDLLGSPTSKGQFDPEERPDVLFVQDGVAYVDPRHELPLQNYLALAQRLSRQTRQRVVLSLEEKRYLTYRAANPEQPYIAPSYHEQLVELLEPAYLSVGLLSGSCDEQGIRIRIQLRKLPNQPINLESLDKLRFVVEPPPQAKWRSSSYTIEFHISGRPADIRQTWDKASTAALELGVYPTGDFGFRLDEQTKIIFTPPALSNR